MTLRLVEQPIQSQGHLCANAVANVQDHWQNDLEWHWAHASHPQKQLNKSVLYASDWAQAVSMFFSHLQKIKMSDFAYHPFPKYLQIREILRRRLRKLSPGDRLPTEAELAEEFGVSRVTVRHVMQTFAAEGIIQRRPRIGTVLKVALPAPLDERLTGPIEEFGIAGLETTSVVIERGETTAEDDVASALRLSPKSQIYEVRRARSLNGAPFVVLEAFFPLNIGKKIASRDFLGLFVPLLRKMVDKDIWEEYQVIDALVAGNKFAEALDVTAGAPILCVKRLFLDSQGAPVVYFRENFRADKYFYTIRLPQPTTSRAKKDDRQSGLPS